MFKRILLAVDGSEHSIRAVKYAIELVKKFDGVIEAVYVVDENTAKKDVLYATNKFEIEAKRKEKIKPIRELLDQSDVVFGTHVLHGEPGPRIVEFAEEREVDCVVIGSRGLNQVQSFLLGSVSHKVAKRAACPVLIVK
ncbi:universal stress protein [Oceanobacillus polygoni]|uniref:Nucleotide-binding universal stress UspA family protein n=1 Tax=Oceanobacillus polygoni TaxID=1235259 RepID=A0A9X0YT50_9BACI|nr:universal stress protein [Oceanobacillus polygoni]MBP2076835.1 nucleotide-binding universal stress UspA family protein [Oceanobacillus polygoni]